MRILKIVILSIACVYALTGCSENGPNNFDVVLGVRADQITNKETSPIEVSGYPIFIEVSMKTKDDSPAAGFYVHLIQKESGAGVKYYYQNSTGFFNKTSNLLPVWLGGESDINKYYQVYAIVNDIEQYETDARGIKEFSKLPDTPVSILNLKRVK